MVWERGQSGNPHGPTRKSKGERLSDLADNYTISALNVIVSVLEDPTVKPGDRLLAARMLLDRAVGTPTQTVDVSSSVTISLVELLAGLPGAQRLPTIEHEAPPPEVIGCISLVEATEAAAELEAATDARQVEQEEDGELILRPANDDLGSTQPGGE